MIMRREAHMETLTLTWHGYIGVVCIVIRAGHNKVRESVYVYVCVCVWGGGGWKGGGHSPHDWLRTRVRKAWGGGGQGLLPETCCPLRQPWISN